MIQILPLEPLPSLSTCQGTAVGNMAFSFKERRK
jgi:hypothetical protein